MRRFLPDTLAGRTIVILVIGLGMFHLWSIWIYQIGTENLLGSAREQGLAEHLVSARRALDDLPPDQREPTAHALSAPDMEIHWSRASLVNDRRAENASLSDLRQRVRQLAPELADDQVRFGYADDTETPRHLLLTSMQLGDGSWMTVGVSAFRQGAAVEHDVFGSLTAMAVGILIVSILLVRSINAPLRVLASAADRIGTDISAQGAPETGPREIRLVARAFNTMQDADQTADHGSNADACGSIPRPQDAAHPTAPAGGIRPRWRVAGNDRRRSRRDGADARFDACLPAR